MTAFLGALVDPTHVPVLLLIGLAVFAGTAGARLFQWLKIPQVVGYIVIGLLVGRSGLHILDTETIDALLPFNFFALGVIGFMIGGELHLDVFKKYGRQFFAIMFAEGIGSFLMVSALVGGTMYAITRDGATSFAFGLLLGAISAATAPAATVDVLREYKTRGPLTTTVFAIVALDDARALALYAVVVSVAAIATGNGSSSLVHSLGSAAWQLIGAAGLGLVVALVLNYVLRWAREHDKTLTFTVGALALVIGLALALGVDLILSAMVLGMTLANLAPRRTRETFQIVERFAPPIYTLFFVIVGARLSLTGTPLWMWVLALVYVIGRTSGKMLGARLGARWSGAAESVRKYLGFTLFSQAGVAIGLAILASVTFQGEMGQAVITVVTVTTFLVQIVGPPSVKFAVKRAGEVGLNVTEDDLARSYRVADVVNRSSPTFSEGTTIAEILRTIAQTDALSYPVTDAQGKLSGVITVQQLKSSFAGDRLPNILVAYDLMEPSPDTITEDKPLSEAIARMTEQDLDFLPVLDAETGSRLAGMLEPRAVTRVLSREALRRRRLADAAHEQSAVRHPV